MADLATLQAWLTEAEAARHALATGGAVKGAMRSGRAMQFAAMTMQEINDYIDRLNQEIARATADTNSCPRRRAIRTCW